ncbi:DUF413 domain-containing protein [Aliikangiella sp. G2MR2-5]|uniref:DUF413 domain-containing protein n=1 Tax=Aliikangiella sp. G2MR2-5 TaxID=2788943 RepID=UPI0018AA6F1D|nr:DUF413 domain-containing protein [Aliikangiella sp. G2MR2-5]
MTSVFVSSKKQLRSYWLSKRFFDSRRFPYGFSRSGIFSLKQSQLLESKGQLFKALLNNLVHLPTCSDQQFVKAVLTGEYYHLDPEIRDDVYVWLKYQTYSRDLVTLGEPGKKAVSEICVETLDIGLLDSGDIKLAAQGSANDDYMQAS